MATVALLVRLLGRKPTQQRNFVWLRMLSRQSNFTMSRETRCLCRSLRFNFNSGYQSSRINIFEPLLSNKFSTMADTKASSTTSPSETKNKHSGESANMGLLAKFKQMYKQYWYVLIPVHVVTSVGWFGGFYYLSKCGIDIPALLQCIPHGESALESIQGSDMGHYAFAYLFYKLTTPVHYAFTLGCTTVSINYLVQRGYIKPVPTKNKLINMYEDKKAKPQSG